VREADANDYWPIAPDLAVEVVSPSDRAAEVLAKVAEYLEAGTRLVWVVYPQTQKIVVYRPSADVQMLSVSDTLEGGDVVPGFACPVAEVFA
jgi:Uma2 family endonuclease